MREQLTNEQIARVFSMYYGCEYKKRNAYMEMNAFWLYQEVWENRHVDDLEDCKLLLTPLSKISDEDAIEINKIYYTESRKGVFFQLIDYFKDGYKGDVQHITSIHQYLIQRGYAVPLFFAPNHPLNGKTAIELGIAIDKTNPNQQQ